MVRAPVPVAAWAPGPRYFTASARGLGSWAWGGWLSCRAPSQALCTRPLHGGPWPHGGTHTGHGLEQTCASPHERTLGCGATRENLQKGDACS